MVLLARNQNDKGIKLFMLENIPSEALANVNLKKGTVNSFAETYLQSKKWLISFSYKT